MTTLTYPPGVHGVVARDGRRCLSCRADVYGVIGHGWDVIRRQEAGVKGTLMPHLHLPSNLITVCGRDTFGCAGRIRRRESRHASIADGFVVDRDSWPADVPIVIDGQRVWLTDDGAYATTPPVFEGAEVAT